MNLFLLNCEYLSCLEFITVQRWRTKVTCDFHRQLDVPLSRFLNKAKLLRSFNREIKHYVYGKRQTVDSFVSQKRENLRFSTCFTLLRTNQFDIWLNCRIPGSIYSHCICIRTPLLSSNSFFRECRQGETMRPRIPELFHVMLNLTNLCYRANGSYVHTTHLTAF